MTIGWVVNGKLNTESFQKDARKGALTSLLNKFFGGSPEVLAQHLMEETDIELDDFAALQKQIDRADD